MAIENMIIQYLRDNKELLANMDFQTLYNNLPPGLCASLTKKQQTSQQKRKKCRNKLPRI